VPIVENQQLLPTFLGLGAQRAGTTWLYACLAEHPEVFMTRKKELYFFHRNYELGLGWYEQQFAEAGDRVARGEITPDYMYREVALQRIGRDLPDVRAFIILRDPIERALSAFALHPDRYASLTFRQAVEGTPSLIERGLYTRHLDAVEKYIERDRLKVFLYDDIVNSPGRLFDEVCSFIGVQAGLRPAAMGKRINRVIYPGTQKALQQLRLGWVIDLVKQTPVGNWVRRRNSFARKNAGAATPEDLEWMADYFADDVRVLSGRIGRDLSHWLR
jgi:hypothetical protein